MHKCILIVDDNYGVRMATRKFLEKQTEFSVCGEAIDGLDAIEKAQQLSPDLIVLDLSMPRMNGLETARKLRAMSIGAPIILFTMYADVLRPQEAFQAGISAIVSKMDLVTLQHHIEELLVTE